MPPQRVVLREQKGALGAHTEKISATIYRATASPVKVLKSSAMRLQSAFIQYFLTTQQRQRDKQLCYRLPQGTHLRLESGSLCCASMAQVVRQKQEEGGGEPGSPL
eukprot:256146-Amphidinium_carterae.1